MNKQTIQHNHYKVLNAFPKLMLTHRQVHDIIDILELDNHTGDTVYNSSNRDLQHLRNQGLIKRDNLEPGLNRFGYYTEENDKVKKLKEKKKIYKNKYEELKERKNSYKNKYHNTQKENEELKYKIQKLQQSLKLISDFSSETINNSI